MTVCRLAVQSLLRLGRIPEIPVWVGRAEEAAGDDPFLEICIAPIRSYPDMFAGRLDKAAEILERAAALLPDPRTDEEVRAMALVHGNLGILYAKMRIRDESEHQLRRAIELAERTGDRSLVLDNQTNLSVILSESSRFDEALELQRRCAEEYEAMGYHQGLSTALFNMAQIELELDDWERAILDLERSLVFARRMKNLPRVARTASLLGYHLTRHDHLGKAKDIIEESLRLYEEHDFDNRKGLAYAVRALYDAKAGDAESARRYVKLAEKNPTPDSRPPLDEVLNLVHDALGEAENA